MGHLLSVRLEGSEKPVHAYPYGDLVVMGIGADRLDAQLHPEHDFNEGDLGKIPLRALITLEDLPPDPDN